MARCLLCGHRQANSEHIEPYQRGTALTALLAEVRVVCGVWEPRGGMAPSRSWRCMSRRLLRYFGAAHRQRGGGCGAKGGPRTSGGKRAKHMSPCSHSAIPEVGSPVTPVPGHGHTPAGEKSWTAWCESLKRAEGRARPPPIPWLLSPEGSFSFGGSAVARRWSDRETDDGRLGGGLGGAPPPGTALNPVRHRHTSAEVEFTSRVKIDFDLNFSR